jgi:GAF domain-containing protein
MFWDNQPAWEVVNEAKDPVLHSLMGYYRGKEMGILTEKLLNKEIICCEEIRTLKDASIQRFLKSVKLRAFIALPIQTRSGQIGVLSCGHSETARVWTEVELLQAVAEQLAIALNQAELYSEASTTAFIAQSQA